MKKLFLLSALFFLFAHSNLNAQIENRFSIGPRIGLNFANSDQSNSKGITGFTAGITSTYSINEGSGITVDLIFSGEGYKSGTTEINLNYFKIPILYDVFFGKLGESFRPKIYAGFSPGFLINSKVNEVEVKNLYKKSVFDLVGGLGFNYRLANRVWLNTDLRALLGLSSMVTSSGDIKNRTVQLSFGVAYGL